MTDHGSLGEQVEQHMIDKEVSDAIIEATSEAEAEIKRLRALVGELAEAGNDVICSLNVKMMERAIPLSKVEDTELLRWAAALAKAREDKT